MSEAGHVRGARSERSRPKLQPRILTAMSSLPANVPVTFALIVVHVVVFLRPGPLNKLIPGLNIICDRAHQSLKGVSVKQSLSATFFHASASHLVYDMISLLWCGAPLEKSMGSLRFASTLAILEGLSQCLRFIAKNWLGAYTLYSRTSDCVVGFSATLFALKVVLEKQSHKYSVPGLPTVLRLTIWVEILLLYAYVPETSATGHVCGILAGYLYVYISFVYRSFIAAILLMVTTVFWLQSSARAVLGNLILHRRRNRTPGNPIVGHGREGPTRIVAATESAPEVLLVWQCQKCRMENGVFFALCQVCGTPRSASGQYIPSAPLWPTDR